MKRQGLFFAAFVFLGGILRLASTGTVPVVHSSPPALPPAKAQNTKIEKSIVPPSGPQTAYERAFAESIAGYFACAELTRSSPNKDDESHWRVPTKARGNVQFLIAIVPDPVHTHLALLFDRTIESLQQAVQHQGDYSFDRSILPWKLNAHKAADGVAERQSEDMERRARESFPGLLIFRTTTPTSPGQGDICSSQRPLFVFLVAETPTSGIRSNQFQNALKIEREIRAGVAESGPAANPRIFILGPNFSGSLDSLSRQLKMIPQKPPEAFVYSGSVTSANSMDEFKSQFEPLRTDRLLAVHFASFQENDEFSIQQFLRYATCKGYKPEEIAVLSEDDTAYGAYVHVKASPLNATPSEKQGKTKADGCGGEKTDISQMSAEIVHLHFPREISYFRSAYEKELAAKQDATSKLPGKTTLSLNLEEESTDDDAVAPYAGSQTSLSQEAVMLGVVSELQKHHIKFTILLATNPVDQLFLARYLRNSYPQGRVVVTQPDLLLLSQEDSLLEGVLGLNIYPLVPGQSDLLCDADSPEVCVPQSGQPERKQPKPHQDRLFESSSNIGTFNAMVGLLTALRPELRWSPPTYRESDCQRGPCIREKIPSAPYAEYGSPCVTSKDASATKNKDASPAKDAPPTCPGKPLTWLTILGHDGYWPIAALSDKPWKSVDHKLPIFKSDSSDSGKSQESTLLGIDAPALVPVRQKGDGKDRKDREEEEDEKKRAHTTPAWNIAYCLCFVALLVHAILSCTGTFLADSEMRAQFAGTHDKFGAAVMAIGAFWLCTAFVLIMCARSPLVDWRGDGWLTPVLWAPLPIFVGFVLWDFWVQRKRRLVASVLFLCVSLSATFQLLLAYDWFEKLPILWSTRYIHFASEVSPIPPFLLLIAAGYWWVWLSLRGMSIVDLRRPRLPNPSTLGPKSFRMSDKDGEAIRSTAHPVLFAWRVLIVIVGVYIISLTVLDLRHPLQSLEGVYYDWGYCAALAFAIAVYLGCLIRLTSTWFSYKHVLTGLDRSPLREAFSRMKRLSWKSMWNPGGSTLRETYRVMSRTFENLDKLKPLLEKEPTTGNVLISIGETNRAYEAAVATYGLISSYPQSAQPRPPANAHKNSGNHAEPNAEESAPLAPATISSSAAHPSTLVVTGATATLASVSAGTAVAMAREATSSQEKEAEAAALSTESESGSLNEDQSRTAEADQDDRTSNISIAEKPAKRDLLHRLVQQIETLQKCMADTAGFLIHDVLTPKWLAEQAPVVSIERRIKKDDLSVVQALAEEYSALVYVNFLQSVLLQMRTLVICAAGMYVFIVCSISIYPFEPHPALQVLAVALLLVMGVIVGFVYSEMHRDAILNRLTSTTAGELGWDFWVKFIAAGALPLFSLLAVQFPEIGRFLFSWLEPLLQSAK